MNVQERLFDIGGVLPSMPPGETVGVDADYLRKVQPVIEALGAQLGQTENDATGLFRITSKPEVRFMDVSWASDEGTRGDVVITTSDRYDNPDWNLSHFSRRTYHQSQRSIQGFLMAVGRDAYTQQIYGVFYTDCTDTGTSMHCIDLLDIKTVERYSKNAQTVLAMYQNAVSDGNTSGYPRAQKERWGSLTVDQMQHIIDRYWPEPELVFNSTDLST